VGYFFTLKKSEIPIMKPGVSGFMIGISGYTPKRVL
jgi:hypothetical protein